MVPSTDEATFFGEGAIRLNIPGIVLDLGIDRVAVAQRECIFDEEGVLTFVKPTCEQADDLDPPIPRDSGICIFQRMHGDLKNGEDGHENPLLG